MIEKTIAALGELVSANRKKSEKTVEDEQPELKRSSNSKGAVEDVNEFLFARDLLKEIDKSVGLALKSFNEKAKEFADTK
jgi:hypothetical protein